MNHQVTNGRLIYSELDARRLREVADTAVFNGFRNKHLIRQLNREINNAEIRTPEEVPPNVVTMRSVVLVTDLSDGSHHQLSLQYPDEADAPNGHISVLTPTGLALIGAVEGQVVSYEAPSGTRQLRVDEILYQPEAQKDYTR